MSPYIPGWLMIAVSPLQQAINRFVPERFRPVTFMAMAAVIVAAVTAVTPLDWPDFAVQLREVFAALAVGWVLSRPLEPKINGAVVGALFLIAGVAIVGPGMAQTASDAAAGAGTGPRDVVANEASVWIAYLFGWLGSLITRAIRGKQAEKKTA